MLYSAYLIELAMLDYGMLKFSYSMLAAASVYASNIALHRMPVYPHHLARHAGYAEEEVLACAQSLAHLFVKAPSGASPNNIGSQLTCASSQCANVCPFCPAVQSRVSP